MAKPPLAQAALRLRNADPEGFHSFLSELSTYTDEVTVAVTSAPSTEVLTMQGHARALRALLRVLRECHLEPPQQSQFPAS